MKTLSSEALLLSRWYLVHLMIPVWTISTALPQVERFENLQGNTITHQLEHTTGAIQDPVSYDPLVNEQLWRRRFKTRLKIDALEKNQYDITIPILVDEHDDVISDEVVHNYPDVPYLSRRRREAIHDVPSKQSNRQFEQNKELNKEQRIFYQLTAFGSEFRFNLSRNTDLLGPSLRVEYWNKDGVERVVDSSMNDCYLLGHIVGQEQTSSVAISNCHGLRGVFSSMNEDYILEPLPDVTDSGVDRDTDRYVHHVVYKSNQLVNMGRVNGSIEGRHGEGLLDQRSAQGDLLPHNSNNTLSSTYENLLTPLRRDTFTTNNNNFSTDNNQMNEERNQSSSRRVKRSFSKANYVETLVVVDKQMVIYHRLNQIEPYILTMMNIVAKLYRDPSIGNSIHIVVNRIIVLSESRPDLEITYHADKTLESFCRWQQKLQPTDNRNKKTGGVRPRHDMAILITRYDICTYRNQPCGTLGLAPMGGMCEPDRSCGVIEDIGMATAFTIAHEMGHSLGMQHDGTGNTCGQPGFEPAKIMAGQLAKKNEPFSWSSCSREYITAFLDSGKGICLENEPRHLNNAVPDLLAGQIFSGDAQCKYQFGAKSLQCKHEVDSCRELWCYNLSNQCVTNSIPAAEGTHCITSTSRIGWCYRGTCVKSGWRPKAVDGQWNVWTSWSGCTCTCGGGIKLSERHCDKPRPLHGGKYCVGERKRYKSCGEQDCPINSTDFREMQCTKYNLEPFRGKYYKWKPFFVSPDSDVQPCALNCLAVGHNFYAERSPKVIDGTRCYTDLLHMCINGKCQHVGCDRILGSTLLEDKCRVCGGNGSSCQPIQGLLEAPLERDIDSYVDIVRIPRGSTNILVTETNISRNYLAIKSSGNKYYINGDWTIDWPRRFTIANTTFAYERPSNKPETFSGSGPTSEELVIMLLVQERNLGVHYEFNIPAIVRSKEMDTPKFVWKYSAWTPCSTSCAKGVSRSKSVCYNQHRNIGAMSTECRSTKPSDRVKYCNTQPCQPEWSVGNWSVCSKNCGRGTRSRLITCNRRVDQSNAQTVARKYCTARRPKAKSKCNEQKCEAEWTYDSWSECRPYCGPGVRTRNIYCTTEEGGHLPKNRCDKNKRPAKKKKVPTATLR